MPKAIFVTGTGTDIGKTHVCTLLLRALASAGVSVSYVKPVASGCDSLDGVVSPDEQNVLKAVSVPVDCWMHYKAPVAPYSAQLMGEEEVCSIALLRSVWQEKLAGAGDYLFEGIGGVAVPLNEQEDVADLIAALEMPALVVASAHLGTINHTCLTVNYLRAKGVSVLGVILNAHVTCLEDCSVLTNRHVIETIGQIPVIMSVDFGQTELTRVQHQSWMELWDLLPLIEKK